jgi:hypothetical protein
MHKTLVVVEHSRLIPEQYEYFSGLLEGKITKSYIHRDDALILTPTHRIRFVVKNIGTTGMRCNHLIFLGEKDEAYYEVFLPTVRRISDGIR